MYAFRNLVFLIRARHFWQSSVGVIWPCFSAAETCNIDNSKNPLLSQHEFQILHWGRQTEWLSVKFWSKAWIQNQENLSALHLVQWTSVTTPSAWRWFGGYTFIGQAKQLCSKLGLNTQKQWFRWTVLARRCTGSAWVKGDCVYRQQLSCNTGSQESKKEKWTRRDNTALYGSE